MKIKILLFLLNVCFLSIAHAWDYTGHKVVAKIAYTHLTPETKAEVDRLTRVLDKHFPAYRGFVSSATWADWIRTHDVNVFDEWHYIDQPLYISSDYKLDKVSINPKNVVWGISQSLRVLRSPKANDMEKSLFLRLLIHFVGDIHQPLHCVSLYSPDFPKGDQGGSLFLVKSPYGDNLHVVWDRGVGYFKQVSGKNRIDQLAEAIEKNYPPEYFGSAVTMMKSARWAKDCYQMAKEHVYTIPQHSTLSSMYIQQGQQITQKQIALAGYRLAELLNEIFSIG